MEGERENSRDQNEGSGQQQPIGQNDENQFDGQDRQQQPGGQSTQQELDQADRQQQNEQSSDNAGGFVGSQGEDSGEYLQQGGNPESGFAEQGSGASNDSSDIEGTSERSENRESDIEGSSDNI